MRVTSHARLHFGFYRFLDLNLAYGSMGLSLEHPKFQAEIRKADDVVVRGGTKEIIDIVGKAVKKLGVKGVEVVVHQYIPFHVGLGATTQTSLAIAYALNELYGLGYTVEQLAAKLGRGFNSGVGLWTFKYGGFVVDSGRVFDGILRPVSGVEDLPRLLVRLVFPSNWIFVLAMPKGFKGKDEVSEVKSLEKPRALPQELQCELYRLLVSKLLPSIALEDLKGFGEALTRIQEIVGDYFASEQGGRFCCEETFEAIKIMKKLGAAGVGQSSWGPTCYGIVDDHNKALKIVYELAGKLSDVDVVVSSARNSGFEFM